MKIHYTNVCSIRKASVEFKPGELICIAGETNQGKSALFYSLLAGLTNSPEFKNFINNEALKEDSKAFEKICLIDDNGDMWEVQAGKGYLYYRTNKAKYEKVGRKNIFELSNLQIPGLLYDPEDSRQIMNLQGEDDGLFPIDRSDSQIFKTYERLLSLSCTEDILRTIKLDKDDIEYKKSDLLNAIQKNSQQLVEIDSCLSVIEDNKIESKLQVIQYLKELYDRLSSGLSTATILSNYVLTLSNYSLSYLEYFNTTEFQQKLNDLVKATSLNNYCSIVTSLTHDNNNFDTNKAFEVFESYQKVLELTNDYAALQTEIDKDNKTLQGINLILNDIKICPYCGRPMEDK